MRVCVQFRRILLYLLQFMEILVGGSVYKLTLCKKRESLVMVRCLACYEKFERLLLKEGRHLSVRSLVPPPYAWHTSASTYHTHCLFLVPFCSVRRPSKPLYLLRDPFLIAKGEFVTLAAFEHSLSQLLHDFWGKIKFLSPLLLCFFKS